jgi:hypothetical protein
MQYSSYDRGYDPGQTDVSPMKAPTIQRNIAPKGNSHKPWKMIIAVAMVAIMVASGFVMIAPTLKFNHDKSTQSAPKDNPAEITIGGTHYVNTTISNMFESYLKVTTANGGTHGSTPGVNDWWVARQLTYGDIVMRSAYPYVIGYNPYSGEVPGAGVAIPLMKYGLYSFYRTTIDSPSLTTISTGANMPLGFVPVLGTPWTTYNAMSGGWVNWSYYLTYATTADITAAETGTGYMRSYYGVTPAQFNFGGANANDGWYVDFQGKVDFNRAAAKKFLGLTGSADLRTQFNFNNTGVNMGNMNASWSAFWTMDGSNAGHNDTYAAYDYSLDAFPLSMFLSVDPASTATKLILRVYGICWGVEELMIRYLDRSGVQTKDVTSPEDWYLNGTASPTGADIKSRMVSVYNIIAWKDQGFFSPAWFLDVLHIDYTPNTGTHVSTGGKWLSRYNPYMATKTNKYTYMAWSPGTLNYGVGCAYWYPPMNWNLLANEKIVIKLPSTGKSVAGYEPYKGTGPQDTLTAAKQLEIGGDLMTGAGHLVWGEIGLGYTTPNNLRSATYYDHATKTLTLTGPMAFARNPNVAFPLLNATGSPSFSFDVMRVSNYTLTPTTLPMGISTLTVTAKNNTGATVDGPVGAGLDWNGTVNLTTASTGINFGGKTWVLVKFSNAGNGVATTQVTVTTAGTKTITATDVNNSLDIITTTTFTAIGEFPTLLIPVIGIIAAVVITVGRRDKKKDKQ